MGFHDAEFEKAGSALFASASAAWSYRRAYGRAAFEAALENGLMPEELGEVLRGRRVVEAFPVETDESIDDYAHRAVSEMMVAYLRYGFA